MKVGRNWTMNNKDRKLCVGRPRFECWNQKNVQPELSFVFGKVFQRTSLELAAGRIDWKLWASWWRPSSTPGRSQLTEKIAGLATFGGPAMSGAEFGEIGFPLQLDQTLRTQFRQLFVVQLGFYVRFWMSGSVPTHVLLGIVAVVVVRCHHAQFARDPKFRINCHHAHQRASIKFKWPSKATKTNSTKVVSFG